MYKLVKVKPNLTVATIGTGNNLDLEKTKLSLEKKFPDNQYFVEKY